MLVKTRCEYCESEDLSLIDMVYGKGTLGERIEKGFKCNVKQGGIKLFSYVSSIRPEGSI